MLTAHNPEAGDIAYTYDDAGNVLTRTSGAGGETVVVTNNYTDPFNRLVSTNYSDSTPDVAYVYDTADTANRPLGCTDDGPKMKLASVSTSASSNYYYYNKLGQTVCSRQKTGTNPAFDFIYANSPAGQWKSVTYPSGRTITSTLDNAGRITKVAGSINYAAGITYAAPGGISQFAYGNSAVESASYNSLLQITDIKLGTTAGGSQLWSLHNGFPATGNNGNITSQTITFQGAPSAFTSHYQYDGVNRLALVSEDTSNPQNPACPAGPVVGTASNWWQRFDYEEFQGDGRGNRKVEDACNTGLPIAQPTTFDSNNRIADAGFSYDSRGNLARVPSTYGTGDRFVYDAENRQVGFCTLDSTCAATPAVGRTQYGYDGEGRRVTKTDQSGTIVYTYDARGRLAAEYGGTVVGTGTHYLTADHLGSTRVITDATRNIVECTDFLPFGEEVLANSSNGRNSIPCYLAGTAIKQKFTGKERDEESHLDYFGARYLAPNQGRFTSSDPVVVTDARMGDPQRFNLYVYARNNPVKFLDPYGEDIIEYINAKFRKRYEQWKSNLLSTEEGRRLWSKFEKDKNFTVTISVSADQSTGAKTTPVISDNSIVGADIVLGDKISDAKPAEDTGYLVTGALGKAGVGGGTIAATVFAHEFGHVEDYTQRQDWFLSLDNYNKRVNAEPNPSERQKIQNQFFGHSNLFTVQRMIEYMAERNAATFIEQKLGKRTPKSVERGVEKLRSVTGGN